MAQDAKKSFLLYYDYRKHLALLSDTERGQLLMALLDYGENGKEPELGGAALMAFSFIKDQMDRDAAKYAETVKKRSEAGKQGGRPTKQTEAKKANAFSEKQTQAKKPDTDTVTVTDTVTDKDIDTDKDIEYPLPPKGAQQPVPFTQIMEAYHEICVSYSRLRTIDGDRRRQVSARWKKYKELAAFRELFEKAEASDFLKGQNDRGWTADFDWLIKPTNMSKVLEGKYDNDKSKGGQGNGANQEHTGAAGSGSLSGFHSADE